MTARVGPFAAAPVAAAVEMTMKMMIAWLMAWMLASAPPGRSQIAPETADEGRARYEAIAQSFATVAYDPAEKPLAAGPRGRAFTLSVLAATALHESGFRRDVDLGEGSRARGSGVDSCLLQIRVGRGRTAEGWTHEDLVGDREKCARAALHLMQRSFGACRRLELVDRLAGYTRGTCVKDEPFSRARVGTALGMPPAPVDDAGVLAGAPGS